MEFHKIAYEVSHRKVKYPRLEFKTGELLLVLPPSYDQFELLNKHRSWISKKAEFIKQCLRDFSNKKIVERVDQEFKDLLDASIEEASKQLGAKVNKVYLRKMNSKWASCSFKRNLTVNRLMKHLPDYLVEYIIFHEVAHIIEKRHSDKFWELISKKFNNYDKLERDLFIYWFRINSKRL